MSSSQKAQKNVEVKEWLEQGEKRANVQKPTWSSKKNAEKPTHAQKNSAKMRSMKCENKGANVQKATWNREKNEQMFRNKHGVGS
jgi:hypothetical protein